MKILKICIVDYGGAANSAIRLHLGLLEQCVESKMLFLESKKQEIITSYY